MIEQTFPITVGSEKVRTERILLNRVENGVLMRGADSVRFLVIHCSATPCNKEYTAEQMLRDHRQRGFRSVGYHFYIRRNGEVSRHRKLLEVGAHARGYNRCSIGICYEGGLNTEGQPADTRTPQQKAGLEELLATLHRLFPGARIVGHRELPGVRKDCPCFACEEYRTKFR